MIETADDLAIMFGPEFAKVAFYRPIAGGTLTVSVIARMPDQAAGVGVVGAVARSRRCLIRAAQMPAVGFKAGDALVVDGASRKIVNARADETGNIVELELGA